MKFVGRSVWLFAAAAPLGAVAGSVAAFDADGRGPKKVGRELAGGGGKKPSGQGGQGSNGGGNGGGNNGKKPAASGSRGYSTLGLDDAPEDALQQLAAETDEAVTNKPKSSIGGRMGRGNGGQGKGGGGGQSGGGGQGGGQGKPKQNARRLENTTAEVAPAGHLIMTPDLSESQLEAFGVYLNDTAQEGLGYHNRIEEGDDGYDEVEVPAEVEDDTTNDGDDAAPDYEGDDGGEEPVEGAMEETTGAGNVFESDGRRGLRGTKPVHRKLGQNEIPDTNALGTFYPLDCNDGLDSLDCAANLFSALVGTAGAGPVEVPCGQCYTYDLDGGEHTIGGLNVLGKLYVPPNHKSTLKAPYVIVQGELEMSDTNPISKDNESMKIVLVDRADGGTTTFVPHGSDAGGEGSLDIGEKAFVVAGGRVNIRGWDGDSSEGGTVESWTSLLSMAEQPRPTPPLSTVPGSETTPLEPPMSVPLMDMADSYVGAPKETSVQCPRQVIAHDFDESVDRRIWSGGDGDAIHHTSDGKIVLHPHLSWQGFKVDFTEVVEECPLIALAKYLVTFRIKIEHADHAAGSMTQCEATGQECPRLMRTIIHGNDSRPRDDRWFRKGAIGRYGEWFTFSQTFDWDPSENELAGDIRAQTFTIDHLPANATVSLDWFTFELPSEKSFAPPDDACAELIPNGDAEDNDGNGFAYFPWYSPHTHSFYPAVFEEEDGAGGVNRFYRNRGRSYDWIQQRVMLNSDCLVKGFVYTISFKLRIASGAAAGAAYYLRVEGKRPDGSPHRPTLLQCPQQTTADGWVTCEGPWMIEDDVQELTDVFWDLRITGENGDMAVIDLDDISIAYKSGPTEGLNLDEASTQRWGANSDIHITSSTLRWSEGQEAAIASLGPSPSFPGVAKVGLDVAIASVLSEKETPGMGVEVALLTRNIKIEGGSDPAQCGFEHLGQEDYRGDISVTESGFTCQAWSSQTPWAHTRTPENYPDSGLDGNACRNPGNVYHRAWCYTTNTGRHWEYCKVDMCRGGYMQVLHTPGVPQVIEGVEFSKMGQQRHRYGTDGNTYKGGRNRFPLHFLYTGDVPGTSIARNSIRDSQHRCIVLDGVSNATVASNVAHETAGHCYYVGYEATDNLLINNLGSKTVDRIEWTENTYGMNDHHRATFFIRNFENDFIGNVAGGSSGRGFELDGDWRSYGEDHCANCNLIGPGGNMRRKRLGIFRGNKAHSCLWQGFRMHHLEQSFQYRDTPEGTPVFEDMWAYRNREHGIYTYNVVAAEWRGGVLSDNQYGLVLRVEDKILVQDWTITGSTQVFHDHTVARDLKLCGHNDGRLQGRHQMGIEVGSQIWRTGHLDPYRGLRMRNVTFEKFDHGFEDYPCDSSLPIFVNNYKYDGHFDYLTSAESVNVIDDRNILLDGCNLESYAGVTDLVYTDLDGSLDFTNTATSGSLVSNFPHVTDIFDGACTDVGNCLAYCPEICARTFSLKVEQFGTEDWKLRITNVDTNAVMDVPGTIRYRNDIWVSDAYSGRRFSASIPAGTYTAEFLDENNQPAWPQYVEEQWQKEPDCPSGYAMPGDITLVPPSVDASFCNQLVRDTGVDTCDPFLHTFGDRYGATKTGPGMGRNASDAAVVTEGRYRHYMGIGQDIDSRCLEPAGGGWYEFAAWMKVTAKGAQPQPVQDLDPNGEWWRNWSPIMTFNGRKYRDQETKEFAYTWEDRDRAVMTRPYQTEGWNLVHGIAKLPESFRVFFEIERAPDNMDFVVDDVSFTKMECSDDEIVLNGDLETGDSKFWDTWGGDVKLDIVDGYGGEGSALRATSRPHLSHGPAQIVNTDCASDVGDRLALSARIKFENAGTGVTSGCNPFTWRDDEIRCSDVWMYTNKAGAREWHRVALIVTDESAEDDGWYHIHGLWTLRPNQVLPDYTKLYFDGISTAHDVTVDDFQVKHLPFQCDALIENPSFEYGSAYWTTENRNLLKAELVQGAGGPGDFALRTKDRWDWWRGLRQKLDTRCFVSGEEYSINAKFRMLNATSGEGVMCNTNDQWLSSENCPNVVVYGWNCDAENGDTSVYWNFWNEQVEWNPDAFNDFSAAFTVSDRLASCDDVHVYLHRVHVDFDIVVDDFQISKYTTDAPTPAPTMGETEPETIGETDPPSTSPTSRPTVSTTTACPVDEGTSSEIPSGPIMLARSGSLCILTKAANGGLSSIAPVALSYDGADWEKAAGGFATSLLYGQEFGNYADGSHITLPALTGDEKYYLTSYSHVVSETDKVARLLETATFGTTDEALNAWQGGAVTTESVKGWIQEQMDLPATSHRAFFRQRVNPRLTHPVGIGRMDHACDPMSRWRNFAFSRKDGDLWWNRQQFEAVKSATDTYITIKLNGHVRTTVDSLAFDADSEYTLEFNKEYEMCSLPQEYEDGSFWIRVNETTRACQALPNPLVQFHSGTVQPPQVLNLPAISAGVLESIDEERSNNGEYILLGGLDDTTCGQIPDVVEERDAPVFGRLPDGTWLQYDPRLVLSENEPGNALPDGGGLVRSLTGDQTKCANAPRTFLNEESCVLSDSPTACGSAGTPYLMIDLSPENLVTFRNITGQYIYAVLGLPLRDVDGITQPWPCEPGLRSRWEIVNTAECTQTFMGTETNASLVELLVQAENSDSNIYLRDITFPITESLTCNSTDANLVEAEIIIGDQCFRRVHPEHLSVYDFTYWTEETTHPGNMVAEMAGNPNPITKWAETDEPAFLVYPAFAPEGHLTLASHPIGRWDTFSVMFSKLGRFGDSVKFVDLPNEVRLDEVAEHFGAETELSGGGIMVCGSPNEVANDPAHGQVFEVTHGRDTEWGLWRQRENVWTQIGLTAPDQLRQRVAWALAQQLVIAEGAIGVQGSHSEVFLGYYDIFVRHAFGNYRDVLREISYSPLMAENLSYLQSKSAAYVWEELGRHQFADENFAREIMQLFSTGLEKLHDDGTVEIDDEGNPVIAYTNDEIMSFARVWTGWDYHQGRGNVEEPSWSGNRHDPMKIHAPWHDKFPKTDMTAGYIGDGYPLCVDLPDKMFLRKGATYRLLGASHMPELMEDDAGFANDSTLKKFILDGNSALKAALCNEDANGNCQYANSVTLESSLSCTVGECDADTLRVVQVSEGIHYEFVRPPCVEQVFYADAKKVINKARWADSSCANPLLPYASEACCEGQHDTIAQRADGYLYDQERVMFSTAGSRCEAMSPPLQSCDFNSIEGIESHKQGYHWTTDSCVIQVKVTFEGQVALVYEPESYEYLHPHIRNDNRNFFKVYWDGDWPLNDGDVSVGNNCGAGICESLPPPNGGCLCSTTITESRVFSGMPGSVDEVLSKLTIGAYETGAFDAGTYMSPETVNGVTVYKLAATDAYDTKTVIEVTDEYGRLFRFKNTKERVRIQGAPEFAFRNAPSFMSVLNTEATMRDAQYEVEAALDHYFYHDNTAPFMAFRLIQKLTTSNPKPRYVKAVATAFRTGTYEGIGSGDYGDLGATIAAVLLDPEARSDNLEADPFKGNLREPLLRLMAVMRGMELQQAEGKPIVRLDDLDTKIGQMAHAFPTVFSFMLPEYAPGGRPGEATLVGPETMIMDMPKVVSLLNGMFSLVKYGLSRCHGGFGADWTHCNEGDYSSAAAHLSFSMPYDAATTTANEQAEAVVSKLSTILTSGRLAGPNKETVKAAYVNKLTDESSADDALRLALQLVLTTPQFHTTNLVSLAGEERGDPEPPQPSGAPYKAIVYLMFGGGCDSFQMLVPHTCTGEKDMYAEYAEIRQDVALDVNALLPLKSVTNQVCEVFGVHPNLPTVKALFDDDDLLFFANTGVLTKETDKENYWRDTVTQLFAHNWMQREAQRVDPLKAEDGTGVLGRIRDVLTSQGLSVGAFSLDTSSISLIGEPGLAASPMILSNNGVSVFNSDASSSSMGVDIATLNGKTEADSGVFGEFFSDTLTKSLSHNQLLYDTLSGKETEKDFPNSPLGRQLDMVSKMIDSRNERGTDADVFFVTKGGWDTHSQVLTNQVNLFSDVDASFKAFSDEMKFKNVWDNVVLVETSDFARTLTPNTGEGTDHAWGGHYIMMGGSVKGGQIAGAYPDGIVEGSPLNIGRGRIIPTRSWDSVFLPIAKWAGVGEEDLEYICPNKGNFPEAHFYDSLSLLDELTPSPTPAPTPEPTPEPSSPPTSSPTASPVVSTSSPSKSPTANPSKSPSESPTASPTEAATTSSPSKSPTASPVEAATTSTVAATTTKAATTSTVAATTTEAATTSTVAATTTEAATTSTVAATTTEAATTSTVAATTTEAATTSTVATSASALEISNEEWLFAGANGTVSFPSDGEVLLQSMSDSSDSSDFGVVLTEDAWNGDDVDFQVDYNQTAFSDQWESRFYIFFVPEGTSPESLLQNDNQAGDFEALTAGYLTSKVHATETTTYFNCGTANTTCNNPYGPTVSTKYLEMSLRLRRVENVIKAYYKVPGGDTWVQAGQSMSLPAELHNTPLQFGIRVMKNYQPSHRFEVKTTKLAGDLPV